MDLASTLRRLAAWALALGIVPLISAGLITGYNQALEQISWTCTLATRDNDTLISTDLGFKAIDGLFNFILVDMLVAVELNMEASGICDQLNATFRQIGIDLGEERVRDCRTGASMDIKNELAGSHASCKESDEEALAICADVAPGSWCIAQRRFFRAGAVLNNDPNATDTNMTCVHTLDWWRPVAMVCPPGFYCSGRGTDPRACPMGFNCPEGSSEPADCPLGSVCTLPSAVLPCNESLSPLAKGTDCSPDAQGRVLLPDTCEAGFYCSDGVPLECPEDYFCLQGTTEPLECNRGPCEEGSTFPSYLSEAIFWNTLWIFLFCCSIFVWSLPNRKGQVLSSFAFLVFLFANFKVDFGLELAGIASVYWWAITWASLLSSFLRERVRECLQRETCASWKYIDKLGHFVPVMVLLALGAYEDATLVFLVFFSFWVCNFVLNEDAVGLRTQIALLCFAVFMLFVPMYYIRGGHGSGIFYLCAGIVLASSAPFWYVVLQRMCMTRDSLDKVEQAEKVINKSIADARVRAETFMSSGAGLMVEQTRGNLAEPSIGITIRDLSLYLVNGTPILNEVSLVIPPSSLYAVMGPSGSGKSSITNVLSGRAGYGVVAGTVEINGDPNETLKGLANITGFVPQDDVMHRELTCRENIAFQAMLRLPQEFRGSSWEDWAGQEADRMLDMFGLSHVADTPIGDENVRGISGGQRKRVSIAMEFVAKPALLFLDEPTSGLDATSSNVVAKLLGENARKNSCTTVAVIHQPRYEIFAEFQYVALLATGGYLVYAGPTEHAVRYFSDVLGVVFPEMVNPADTIMDAMSSDSAQVMVQQGAMRIEDEGLLEDDRSFGQLLAGLWSKNSTTFALSESLCYRFLPPLNPERCTWGELTRFQMRRYALQSMRSWRQHLLMMFLQIFGVFACIQAAPRESKGGVLLQTSYAYLFLMLAQSVAAQRVFGGNERFVCWRESGVRINAFYYFLGRDVVSLAEIGLSSAVFCLVYWPLGPILGELHQIFIATCSFMYCTYGYSFLLSASMDASSAQISLIMLCFLCWNLTGLEPPFVRMIDVFPDQGGIYLMGISPIRWVHGYLLNVHQANVQGSQFENEFVQYFVRQLLNNSGYVVDFVTGNETDWTCDTQLSARERWTGGLTKGFGDPSQGNRSMGPNLAFNCNCKHLCYLGLVTRVITMIVLAASSKVHSKGGGTLFEGRKGKNSMSIDAFAPAINNLFKAFLVTLFLVSLFILLEIP